MSSNNLEAAERRLKETIWPQFEAIAQENTERVLAAFVAEGIGEPHFYTVTGYGHDDMGREALDSVFARVMGAEAAMVRPQFVSGTHAIATALRACVHSGQTLISLTGTPYDTLETVIGLRGNAPMSLFSQGIAYDMVDCLKSGVFSTMWTETEAMKIAQAGGAFIQRSRGYSLRPSLSVEQIGALIRSAKALNPLLNVVVDNCYGEFVETREPCHVGADLIAGSLIKNPGGGLAPTGGYIAGNTVLVDHAASLMTAPGIGRDGGYMFDLTRTFFQGLFLAPAAVKEALKSVSLAAAFFESQGIEVTPAPEAMRSDIIQILKLGSPEAILDFCRKLQACSPVDAKVRPEPAVVPGYTDPVVMAGGTFISGSTLELSADAPLRPPYTAFLQGGLTYHHMKAFLKALS